ncbi:kinase-like domain-containing protein [Thelephora terrestris]|uniref:Kinase-like domain-containing protein n=1 Tax=Thelephora terrestris TaxID=56493 RepID=A0A9P6HL59_9AGAM|nr:kinase-like domain-containing protein [Thelephora terrestris]
MMTRRLPNARRAKASVLEDRMNILNRSEVEFPFAWQVFGPVSNILALVKNRLIDNEDAMQLSEYCFDTCDGLKTAILGQNTLNDLDEPLKIALEDLERVMGEIERTIRRTTSTPHSKYKREAFEGYKLEIQQTLTTLGATVTLPSDDDSAESAVPVAQERFDSATGTSFAERVRCLFEHTFAEPKFSSLIDALLSGNDGRNAVQGLEGGDAQSFVDLLDRALLDVPDLSPPIRKRCLKLLYKVCGRHAIIPGALRVTVKYDRMGCALYKGGFADVWKGEHSGRHVAVKVLRTYSTSDLQKIIGKFCKEVVTWRSLNHPNILPLVGVTMSETQFAIVSDWMENGNINEYVKENPDAERLPLLAGVARGLIYIHDQGMIHGDLKGANVLIDQVGNALLADFGLLTIVSDPANLLSSSSYTQGGTARWMSPELIAPQKFGLETSQPTIPSDCYALGMVIYETISGHLPFHQHADLTVFVKVLEGEHPPREAEFTDRLWETLELCWIPEPNLRLDIEDVLRYLEKASQPLEPSYLEIEEVDEGFESDSSGDYSGRSP